ncbi:MAG TPA: MerR family transcriptional regulator [Kofleriaceae bacterium]|nr:MerR family transcriptional regulator [Kofleriaceae bacterium]
MDESNPRHRSAADKLMRVGELAAAVNKTVRAMHLYEELGLLEPRARSEGGFRLYGPEAIDRIHWIVKLQAIGFTLAEIQGFVKDFQSAGSAPEATARVRALFQEKQQNIREQITQLSVIENDINEALAYLDSCQTCSTDYAPTECGACDHQGHQKGEAPPLFAGISKRHEEKEFDVPVTVLYREGNN